jgi:DNA polymerase (family 10)
MAKDMGALVVIDSDAHSTEDFDGIRFGVGQGRRGWLAAQDVLNTRSLPRIREFFRRRRRAH